MRERITAGEWRVPQDLHGSDDWANGVTVLCHQPGDARSEGRLIVDCRGQVPRAEQVANARAIAALPELIEALAEVEGYLGDRPQADRDAMRLHAAVAALMARGLR